MNKFNIRFRELELRSCDDMTTLAEIVLWRKSKVAYGEEPVVVATWDIGERKHNLHIHPNTFSTDDRFDEAVFRKLVKLLAFMVEEFLLNDDEALAMQGFEGGDQFRLGDDFRVDGEDGRAGV